MNLFLTYFHPFRAHFHPPPKFLFACLQLSGQKNSIGRYEIYFGVRTFASLAPLSSCAPRSYMHSLSCLVSSILICNLDTLYVSVIIREVFSANEGKSSQLQTTAKNSRSSILSLELWKTFIRPSILNVLHSIVFFRYVEL